MPLQTSSEPHRAVDDFEGALGVGGVDIAAGSFAIDGVLEVGTEQCHVVGRSAIRDYLRQLLDAVPRLNVRVVGRYRDGTTIIDELAISGIEGLAGCRSAVGVFDVRGGRIQRASIYFGAPEQATALSDDSLWDGTGSAPSAGSARPIN